MTTATMKIKISEPMQKIPDQFEKFTPDSQCVTGYVGWFNTALKGRGAVALQNIPADVLIESDPVIILPIDDIKNSNGATVVIDDYIFCWETLGPDRDSGLFAMPLGNISLCNHSTNPNARIEQDHENRLLKLISSRPIYKGEEIMIDYAIDLWFDPKA